MDQIVDISLPTVIICLGIFFVIFIFRYVAKQVWNATQNTIVRGIITWAGTKWLPLWPVVIGSLIVRFVPNAPVPQMIQDLAVERNITWTIYGAFCGLISGAVVKGIKQLLEKKGIKVDLAEANSDLDKDPIIDIHEEVKILELEEGVDRSEDDAIK